MDKKDIEPEDKVVEDEKEIDTEIKDVASKISAALNLDELSTKVDKILEKDSMAAKVYGEAGVKKNIDELTKEEKIVAFWHSLVSMDEAKIKALSEGTAADGGYLKNRVVIKKFMAQAFRKLQETLKYETICRQVPVMGKLQRL